MSTSCVNGKVVLQVSLQQYESQVSEFDEMLTAHFSRKTRRGFTLVELLVVVSVLGILISILVPGMRGARRVSKRVACGANLRSIGHAMRMYLDESDDYLPLVSELPSFETDLENPRPGIASVLTPYLQQEVKKYEGDDGGEKLAAELADKGNEVFHCPADKPGFIDRGEPNKGKSYFQTENSSYVFNTRLQFLRNGTSFFDMDFNSPVKLSEVVRSDRAKRMFGGQAAEEQIWLLRDYVAFHGKAGTPGAANYLYVDGRVADLER